MDNETVASGKEISMKKAIKAPFTVTFLAALLLVAAFFMPLKTATADYREELLEFADEFNIPEIEMTNKAAVNVSMFEFVRAYQALVGSVDKTWGAIGTAFFATVGVLSVITLIFTLCKKPVAVIIFDILTFGAYSLVAAACRELSSSYYKNGAAYYIYYAALAVVLVGAIWMLVKKVKTKKIMKAAQMASSSVQN